MVNKAEPGGPYRKCQRCTTEEGGVYHARRGLCPLDLADLQAENAKLKKALELACKELGPIPNTWGRDMIADFTGKKEIEAWSNYFLEKANEDT